MEINKEIQKIVEYQNAILPKHLRKNEQAIMDITSTILNNIQDKRYDFSKYITFNLDQNGKTRTVRMYKPFSTEEILCIYLKRVLDRKFHVTYPNRNVFIRSLFNSTEALKDMSDFTIYRFDFSDFFNSVSGQFVYKKYIQEKNLERYQESILEAFVRQVKFTYAGLNTSNILCEIIAQKFDQLLMQRLSDHGVIFYKRYIDDGIIIFNDYISRSVCDDIINSVIYEIFSQPCYDHVAECKTSLNETKTNYIARRDMKLGDPPCIFDFLGYEFSLTVEKLKKPKKHEVVRFHYGITQRKIDKYTKRIDKIVEEYACAPHKDMELLRHEIKAFTHRTVYRINHYGHYLWKSKGFISNYNELRFRMDLLTPNTEKFLKMAVVDAFSKANVPIPYFLKGNDSESIYSLYNNMKNYKTMLFVEMIGIDKETLIKMCRKIKIALPADADYDAFTREYLIKVRVGH